MRAAAVRVAVLYGPVQVSLDQMRLSGRTYAPDQTPSDQLRPTPVIQLLGILIVVNAVIVTAWWIGTGRGGSPAALALCALSVFAGIAFVFQDRLVEVTVKGVGTIKTAAEQAVLDAKEVAAMRERIAAQGATVDLVAREAADAKRLVDEVSHKNEQAEEKLSSLDKAIREGSTAVEQLKAYTAFNSTVVAAQTDNRRAYDQLRRWSEDTAYPFQQAALQAALTIMDAHDPAMVRSGFAVPWKQGIDPKTLSLRQIAETYSQVPPQIRIGVLEFVWETRTDIPKKERLEFLAQVLRDDESLQVVEYAGRWFTQGTGDQFKPLAIAEHLKWWAENRESVK